MRVLLIFTFGIFFTSYSWSQTTSTENEDDSTPKYSNEFLNIGVGARALSMSNSYAATADDVYAGYWNPAGLLGIKGKAQGAIMHSEYFAGIAKYDYLGLAAPIDSLSAAGFAIVRFGVDDIPNTTQLIDAQGNIDYDRITSFSAADYGFIFSYARRLKRTGLSFGGNAKIIYRRIGDFADAFGFGIDAAINYNFKKYRFSAVGRDITTTVNSWNTKIDDETKEIFIATGNEIPGKSLEITLPRIIIAAQRLTTISKKLNLITEVDLNITSDGKRNTIIKSNAVSIDPTFGLDLGYKNRLFVRGGIGNIQETTSLRPINPNDDIPETEQIISKWTFQPNFGLGLKLKNIQLDYALTDIGNASDALYSNVFSLKITL